MPFVNKQWFYLTRWSHLLWLRATLMAAVAVGAVIAAYALGGFVPGWMVGVIGETTLGTLLAMLASSMLAVATFSLATLVAAASMVTSTASPRAAALMLDDSQAQNALSVFIGAFIFSVVAMVAEGTDIYDERAKLALFVVTLIVLALVVLCLLRWIDQLSKIGRVGDAIDRVEKAVRQSLERRPVLLGGMPNVGPVDGTTALHAKTVGYLQHVDVAELNRIAEAHDLRVHVRALPGAFIRHSRVVVDVEGNIDSGTKLALLRAVTVGGSRTYEQDPRFGLVVLAEVAARALSPAVNDPGTAIDVVGTAVRLLCFWGAEHWEDDDGHRFSRVFVPALSASDLFDDVFRPISRDGAAMIEVGLALQKAFADLGCTDIKGFREAARQHAEAAMEKAELSLCTETEKAELRRVAALHSACYSCGTAPSS